jgi:hypothetical protein
LFIPIREDGTEVRSGATAPLSGHDTPTLSNVGVPELKPVTKGIEKGAVLDLVEEHVAVLKLIYLR